ncbi:MAG: glycerol kinase GlpK [Polyangiaceae bacterium]|nr:glycerol kinase GlpK [Polyangiaceae bacterium]
MALLAIDQGTTGSTALLLSEDGRTLGRANREFSQHFPSPGWVEHDLDDIWKSVVGSVDDALRAAGLRGRDVAAIGITNQRETTCAWDKATGAPAHRAIVWQDRRTEPACRALREAGHEPRVRALTGLVLDPYFSGTKMAWLLSNVDGLRARAAGGSLALGTVDAFLVHRLSGGQALATDVTNASRTLLMNLETRDWDDELLSLLDVPRAALPEIVPSAGRIAVTRGFGAVPDGTPITGIAGDQQAALFGQACFAEGDVKCTYGTGAFVLVNTGARPTPSRHGLLTTVAWQLGAAPTYALEGASFIAGAAVQWLRDGLGLIERASDVEALARTVESSDGVTFVPALTGLGAPHWDADARGLVCGLTRGTTRGHLARATLEGVAFSVADLVRAMAEDLGAPVGKLRVDGGAAANDLLMQLQSDLSDVQVERPLELESTARGAAMLAGIGAGVFAGPREAAAISRVDRTFTPALSPERRAGEQARWAAAVRRARGAPSTAHG